MHQDNPKNAVMVHLVRPAEAEGSDRIYLWQVIARHPELAEFIHEHVLDEGSGKDIPPTEHVIIDMLAFNYTLVQVAMLKDCRFEVKEWIDRDGERMNLKDHTARLMQKVMSDVEVIG